MKKLNSLSKADMKKVMGGGVPVCPFDSCWLVTEGYQWPDGCAEGFHCAAIPCNGGLSSYNKCVLDGGGPLEL